MAPFMPEQEFRQGVPNFYIRLGWALGLLILPMLVPPFWALAQFCVPGALLCLLEDLPPTRAVALLWLVTAISLGLCIVVGGVVGAVWILEASGLWSVFWICRRREFSGPETLLIGFLFLAAAFLFFLTVASPKGFFYTYGKLKMSVAKQMDLAYQQYIKMGLIKAGERAQFKELFLEWKKDFLEYLPCFFALSFAMISGINTVVSRYVGRRFFNKDIFGPEFSKWKFPDELIWLVIASGALALWGHSPWNMLGKNALVFLGGIYYIQGIAILAYHLKRLNIPAFLRGICYALISLEWYGLLIAAIVGLADVWFDLRRLNQSVSDQEE